MAGARRIHPEMRGEYASHAGAGVRNPDRVLSELASRQFGVVAVWQLRREGVTPSFVESRRGRRQLHEVHRGVYAVGHRALSQHGRWLAAVLAGGPEALLSHRDGLSLWGLPDYRGRDIEVTLPGLGSRRRRGITFHRTRKLDPLDRCSLDGIPVTSVARTLADVAGCISPRHLRLVYLEAERQGLLEVEEVLRVLQSHRGKRGIGRLRRLVAEDTTQLARAKSRLEVEFFDFCRRHDFPEPLVNEYVHGYEVDAYWPQARLAVELDSWEFHKGRSAFERDRARIGDLAVHGIRVLPVTHVRLTREPAKLASVISAALAAPAAGAAAPAG